MRSRAVLAMFLTAACGGDVAQPPTGASDDYGAELAAQLTEDLAGATTDDAIAVIGQVLMTFDDGEMTLGVRAGQRGVSAEVTAFARDMVDGYRAHHDAASAFLDARGIVAQDGRVSAALLHDAVQELDSLDAEPDFDAAYVAGQVTMHETALVLLDALVERERDPAFAALLVDARDAVAERGTRAQALLQLH